MRGTAGWIAAGLACVTLAGCIPPAAEPGPPPAPAPQPAPAPPPPAPTPPPLPAPDDWRDAPQTPGDWRYIPATTGGSAEFAGEPGAAALLSLRCDRARGAVVITRGGTASQLRILTPTQQRMLEAAPTGQGGTIQASLSAHDGLLDAIALARGRFAVETAGQQTLYVPAWPEISRVIEDCR